MTEKYLLDANVFITPHRLYYPFDFAMGFWDQLENKLRLDNVLVLDVVVNEISKYEDELSAWINGLEEFSPVSVKSQEYIVNYGKVLNYVQQCGLYKPQALRNWAEGDVADPWLIAVAMETGATIITMETVKGTLSEKNPSKNAKIPDVAEHFGVSCESLFYFMRQMDFSL